MKCYIWSFAHGVEVYFLLDLLKLAERVFLLKVPQLVDLLVS